MEIKYMHKMGNIDKDFLCFKQNDIPKNIIDIIITNEKFMESATFGEKGLGKPDEIESLIIEYSDSSVKTFTYYNKSIHYTLKGDKSMQPVFQVFTYFMMKYKLR